MRIDASLLLLGLATFSNLPAGSARVLYGYASSDDVVGQNHNVTNVEQRAVVPLKPVVKPVPDAPEAPIVPGDKTPNAPGDKTPDSEPAPLVPDRDPAAPATDKEAAPATDKENTPFSKDEQTLDLWCPAEGVAAKRSLEARTGRAGSCRRTRARDREGDELRTYYDDRGRRSDRYVENRPSYNEIDYIGRTDRGYRMQREESPEPFLGDYLERTRFNERGYEHNYLDEDAPTTWSTWETHSPGNTREPVSRVSYGRNDRDEVAMIAHERFADRDSNRYQLDERGRARVDENDDYLPADNWEGRSVPVSQLVHEGARRGGYYNPPPRRMSFMSENIVGVESRRVIDDAFVTTGRRDSDDYMLLRRDSTGPERAAYGRVSAIDNNYSYMNTATRNRDYDNYDPVDIDVYRGRDYATSYNWDRRG